MLEVKNSPKAEALTQEAQEAEALPGCPRPMGGAVINKDEDEMMTSSREGARLAGLGRVGRWIRCMHLPNFHRINKTLKNKI